MALTHGFLENLALVMCVAAVMTLLFQRLRQSVVLGYILAGVVIGPHVPVPLIADRAIIETLSELGVILLMFSLGLEFSLRKLFRIGPAAAVTAVIEISFMLSLGFLAGQALGWSSRESMFAAALISISSTTIIAKTFDELRVKGKLREVVVGVLIVEDVVAVLLLAILGAIGTGKDASLTEILITSARLGVFIFGLIIVGVFVVPRIILPVIRLGRPETILVTSIGICFAVALLARKMGYSVALGAFLAGMLIAESREQRSVERLVQPVRDMFAAIFFVSVGLLIDPVLLMEHWPAVVVLTLAVVLGKLFGVTLGAFLAGSGVRHSVRAGMSLAQIGEFSFIIASLGLNLGVVGKHLYPVAVAVSAVTTLLTPWFVRASDQVAAFVDHTLPKPLQTFTSLYGSWMEQLRTTPAVRTEGAKLRRWFLLLFVDAAFCAGIIIGASLDFGQASVLLERQFGLTPFVARSVIIAVAAMLSLPFAIGIVRVATRIGLTLANAALPRKSARLDLAAAPRRALIVTFQLGAVLLVGIPIVAVTQPFLGGFRPIFVLGAFIVLLAVTFWRSAVNLEGHVRAGAQAILETLVRQNTSAADHDDEDSAAGMIDLKQVNEALPGLGEPTAFQLTSSSPAVGKTLATFNLRGRTGATVLAIARRKVGVIVPSAQEVMQEGDVLAIAGSKEAVAAACKLLEDDPSQALGPVTAG